MACSATLTRLSGRAYYAVSRLGRQRQRKLPGLLNPAPAPPPSHLKGDDSSLSLQGCPCPRRFRCSQDCPVCWLAIVFVRSSADGTNPAWPRFKSKPSRTREFYLHSRRGLKIRDSWQVFEKMRDLAPNASNLTLLTAMHITTALLLVHSTTLPSQVAQHLLVSAPTTPPSAKDSTSYWQCCTP